MIKYQFNEEIFTIINSSEKAYWLGFLYADGYLTSQGSFGCGLAKKDNDQLIKLLKFLSVTPLEQCLKYCPNTQSYRFILTRKNFYNTLISLGFSVQKSYENNLNVWNNIPITFKKDFIIGLWDGDGSFSNSPAGKQLSSLISNNQIMLEAIAEYINNDLGKDFAKVKLPTTGDPYPRIRFSQNKAKKFGDWLYSEGNKEYFLQRKYKEYFNFVIRSKGHPGIMNWNSKGILCLESNKIYETPADCALHELGKSNPGVMNSIRAVCRKERKTCGGKTFRYLTLEEKERYINGLLPVSNF